MNSIKKRKKDGLYNFDIEKIKHNLNTFTALKDVKFIIYRIIWKLKMVQVKDELYRLMEFSDSFSWLSRRTSEALFQFRDLSSEDTYDINTHSKIYKVMPFVGKVIDRGLDDQDIICDLPDKYYTHYSLSYLHNRLD